MDTNREPFTESQKKETDAELEERYAVAEEQYRNGEENIMRAFTAEEVERVTQYRQVEKMLDEDDGGE
jgi:hypothetical protein